MNPRTLLAGVAGGLVLAGAVVAALVWWQPFGDLDAQPPTPSASVTLAPDDGSGTGTVEVPKEGQAADGGDYPPLVVPDGLRVGSDFIPESDLTQPGEALLPGDVAVVNPYQSEASVNPYLLFTVDEVTFPLEGAEREAAIAKLGGPDAGQVVQKVTMRFRHIAGSGDVAGWDLYRSVVPLNGKLQGMPTMPTGEPGCADPSAPLTGNDMTTGNTVRVCLFVYGTMDAPTHQLSNISVQGRGSAVLIQSDKEPKPDYSEHVHNDEYTPDTGH